MDGASIDLLVKLVNNGKSALETTGRLGCMERAVIGGSRSNAISVNRTSCGYFSAADWRASAGRCEWGWISWQ